MEEIRIGDFSASDAPAPPRATSAPSPTQARLEQAEKRLSAQADDAEAKLRPQLSYEERLREVGVTREEAAEIVDSVFLRGFHAEDTPLTSRIKLRLRTRQYRDTQRVQSHLEVARPVYEAHYQEAVSRHALAASLERLGKDAFTFSGREATGEQLEAEFRTRLAFVDALPEPTLRLLFQKLWKFDRKIAAVLEEGAIENF